MEQDTNNIPELQSPFEQLREVDAGGKELPVLYRILTEKA